MADTPWCLIESDPGVFNELLHGFGVVGLQMQELYSLDSDQFTDLKSVHGLIFLFKYRPGSELSPEKIEVPDNVFFAQQVVQNACATQAIINLLCNLPPMEDVKLGSIIEEFKSFTSSFDAMNRGLCLGNYEAIRNVHNSFARQTCFEVDIKGPEKEENYHFITYVPVNNRIYELDGLRQGPIDLGAVKPEEDWLDTVRPFINKRIQKYSEGEIHFNLMAVVTDRKVICQKRLTELTQSGMDTDKNADEIAKLQAIIAAEEEKEKGYKIENKRRRHNYVPFIVELLKLLAKENKLVPLVQRAQEKANNKTKEREEKVKVKTEC